MLSRLSGLANTVLHELSGEGEDAGTAPPPAGPEFESSQQNGEESPEDVLERLAHMEKLVVQLKSLVLEKDAQLQQKDATLQEERQAAEAKLLKLKLQAKVKVANLNKRIEELTAQGGPAPVEGQPEGPLPPAQGDHSPSEGPPDETGGLRRQLQEQEEAARELRQQLEEARGRLGDAQGQICSLQREGLEKETLLEEQALLQCQAEAQQVEAWAAREAEAQQNLRQLQRKVEEQAEALLGRSQVVELLQQELNITQEEKQNLLEKLQKAEAELESSRSTLASAQEESARLVERLELALAEQKAAFQRSQEEVQGLSRELAQARAAQAEREQERQDQEARHAREVAEKNQEMVELQKAEQDLHASYEAVQAENARLRHKADAPSESPPDDASATQGKTPEGPPELSLSQPELEAAAVPSPPPSQTTADQALEDPLPAQPEGQPDLLDSFAEERQHQLSVLLLELQEAQEEIAFLKGQLPLSGSLEAQGGQSQGSDGETEGEGAAATQSDSSSSSLVTVDIQDSPSVLGLLLGPEENETAQGPSPGSEMQSQKIARLELEVAELRRRQQDAVETHQGALEEKSTEIVQLREELQGSAKAVETLDEERGQLLSRLKELCFLAEMNAQAEGSPAHPELQPQLPDYESAISHLRLLKEQIQSLKNEAKSKDVKIVALQNDLDEAQGRLSEQEAVGRNLLGQLQDEQQNARALVEQAREASARAEEQSQDLALKELEANKLALLLSENSLEVERLQQELVERERRMTEVSVGMSDRMVQLNEEKFELGKELKSAMEQLSVLQQGKETREQAVETEDRRLLPTEELPTSDEAAEVLRKENELMRKKLQAALLSRKELLGRVRQLEQEGKGGEGLPAESQEGLAQETEGGGHPSESLSGQGHPIRRGRTASLNQLPSAKEAMSSQVAHVAEECTWPRTVIAELQQRLQQKDLQIDALQTELRDCKLAPEKQSTADQNSEGSSPEDSGAGGSSSKTDLGPEGGDETIHQEFSALVQEREELQKKLQEALVSRKETIKKAKEKERHHRELLKQQKEGYRLLQEQLEQEIREKEELQDQLQMLSKTLESFPPQKPAGDVSSGLVEEFGQQDVNECAPLATGDDSVVGQLKADLEKLQEEKKELEAHLAHLVGELDVKSEKVLLLQEKVEQLLAEAERAEAACSQAEVSMEILKLELKENQEEISRQEKLRHHQEEKELDSREEIQGLRSQLTDKDESLAGLQAELQAKENRIQALQGQLDQAQQLQVELQAKSAETQSRSQLQRKLQAALISRKEALKESKELKDELSGTKAALESAALRLQEVELRASELDKEKVVLLDRLAVLKEERDKLISAVDSALVENQNVTGSCESLKLALEGVTQEKTRLGEEMDSLKEKQAQELSEWRRKHEELQKEYETLLQSYENVSDEAERIQRVMESVRQEKQDLFLRLKGAEAEKKDGEARLQGAEQEMEGMKEKMRKFAKSKQQKILELEEENEQLRLEIHPGDGSQGGTNSVLREELETSKKNCQALSDEMKALVTEKDLLKQEIQDLRQALQNKEDQSVTQVEEKVARSEAVSSTMTSPSEEVAEGGDPDTGSKVLTAITPRLEDEKEELSTAAPLCDERVGDSQQVAELQEQVAALEDKRKMVVGELNKAHGDLEVLKEEKTRLEGLVALKGQELEALQEKVTEMEEARGQTKEQLAEALRLREALEAEKDDLEERLMNQLAELNGSIGNYQQDMANLQSENQQLSHQAEGLLGALSRLEDEKRHLLREKLEAEAEKKENAEKVKSAWKEGSVRTQARELQELLKEKQQEVRQLQKDCIKSQERISALERTIKALEFVQSESKKELEATKRSMAEAEERTKKVQAELTSCRVLLDDTQGEAARVVAESLKVKEELQTTRAQVRGQLSQKEKELERCVEQEKAKHLKEVRNMDERLEALRKKQVLAEESARDLQVSLRRKDQEAKELQGNLNHTLAQLAAFTRSMSSLQDDRDRVIDESRQWEKKFGEAIEKKEQELCAREEACAALQDQAKEMALQVEALQGLVASLERSQSAQESQAQEELQHHQEEVGLLQEEKHRLGLQLEEAQRLLSNSQAQVLQQGGELESLRKQLADLQASFEGCDRERLESSEAAKSHEASLRDCRLSVEQLGADLRASKELTERLHNEMSKKEQTIVRLVAAKEEAVAEALLEVQERHKGDLKELENQLAETEAEKAALEADKANAQEKANSLTEKLKNSYEKSKQHKAQLDSFTKSMSSLQDDRDRVLEDYRQLEQRHLAAILEKDQLIQESAAENNSLKEQLRSLHGQIDDLHAENAKLDAELVRYRQDLNQVISIKDTQQKQLLKTQIDRIQALEKEKAGVEGQLQESELGLANLQQRVEALQLEKQSLEQEVQALKSSISQLQDEMLVLREGGSMLEMQLQLQEKVDEIQSLGGQLSVANQRAAGLEEELARLRQELQDAEAKMKKELKSFHHDTGLLRNETETAEERVAELAKDLLQMEQNLLTVTEENQDLKAQIQSFKKAMSSLQDSWDQSHEERHALEKKYAAELEEQRQLVQSLQREKLHVQETQTDLEKQRDGLTSELAALRDSTEEKGFLDKLEKLNQQLRSKDSQLARISSELETASGQVKGFSQAMGSLQAERDRLLSELDKTRKTEEVKLQSAETSSLKKALSSLQDDRSRLVVELKNLQQQQQQQSLQAGVETSEVAHLKAQLRQKEREMERQQELFREKLEQERSSVEGQLQRLREEKEQGRRQSPPSNAQAEEKPPLGEGSSGSSRDTSGQMASMEDLQVQLGNSLKHLHQKELRIQQLNSKLSQVFEEKNGLTLQLRGSSRSLRESHQQHKEALSRCAALEKQLQEWQGPAKTVEHHLTDAAPGAPQEKDETNARELQELQAQLLESKHQQNVARQGLSQLQQLLHEEQERRLAAEEASAAAQEQMRRFESEEYAESLETTIPMPPSAEHVQLLGSPESSFSKARGARGLQRALRSLFCPRRLFSLLATLYLFGIHVLLLLHAVGRL